MYKFLMSIGDWSDDGHGLHEDYIIESRKHVEVVRETHFKIKEKTGIDVETICQSCRENTISQENYDKLVQLGFQFPEPGENKISPDTMAQIWLFLLNKTDPSLHLKFTGDKELPTLHFYGFDKQGRHIEQIGYGCFD